MAKFLGARILVPIIDERNYVKIFEKPGANPNPVEVQNQPIPRVVGYRVKYTVEDVDTGFTFSFKVQGGINPNPFHTASYFYEIIGSETNVESVDNTTLNIIDITTPAADSGGRTYRFTFSQSASIATQIRKTAGALLTGNLKVTITDYIGSPDTASF